MAAPESELCVAESVSSADDIMRLASDVKRLIGDELGSLCPRFFLATIRSEQWLPRVVMVQRKSEIIGIVYAMERKIAGFRTGLIFCDARPGPIIASKPEERETVWRSAVTYLLTHKTVLGVRLAIPFTERDLYAGERIVTSIGAVASYRNVERSNAILLLSSSYEAFLRQMGPHTRRNFRYYRRQFERNDHAYVESLTIPEFRGAALELLDGSAVPAERKILESNVRMCSIADRPILVGLRASGGKWLAILGGWYDRGQPNVCFQINRDQEYRADSLSVVLRGYLLESLIRRGFRSVIFIHGVRGPLTRCCQNIHTIGLYLDKPNGFLNPVGLLELVARHLPRSLVQHADWIANINPQGQSSR